MRVGSEVYSALADPTRREILDLLRDGPMPAGDLAQRFEISWPAVSRHLAILKAASLVQARRSQRNVMYSLNRGVVVAVTEELGSLANPGDDCFPPGGSFGVQNSERATRAWRGALTQAAELGHPLAGTHHLLLALLSDQEGNAGRLLHAFGATYASARTEVIAVHGGGAPLVAGSVSVEPAFKVLTGTASGTAQRAGHRHVGTTTLLLTLLREQVTEEAGKGARILAALGVDVLALHTAARQELTAGEPADPILRQLAANAEGEWSRFVALERMISELGQRLDALAPQ